MEDWIKTLLDDGRLFDLKPSFAGDAVGRRMLLSQEVWRLLSGPWKSTSEERRCQALRADLEAFVMGEEISVCTTPRTAGDALLGLLDPPADGVWDIRSQDPRPGIRIVGFFATRDLFVGLLPAARSVAVPYITRGPLYDFDSPEWEALIREAKAEWRRLFLSYRPVGGTDLHELLSDKYNLV
jgi:hypothetical protein